MVATSDIHRLLDAAAAMTPITELMLWEEFVTADELEDIISRRLPTVSNDRFVPLLSVFPLLDILSSDSLVPTTLARIRKQNVEVVLRVTPKAPSTDNVLLPLPPSIFPPNYGELSWFVGVQDGCLLLCAGDVAKDPVALGTKWVPISDHQDCLQNRNIFHIPGGTPVNGATGGTRTIGHSRARALPRTRRPSPRECWSDDGGPPRSSVVDESHRSNPFS